MSAQLAGVYSNTKGKYSRRSVGVLGGVHLRNRVAEMVVRGNEQHGDNVTPGLGMGTHC